MSPGAKAVLVASGLLAGGALVSVLVRRSSSGSAGRLPNPLPQGALGGPTSVGAVPPSPGSGTRDRWTDRNHRRRKKRLRMTSKG